MAHITDVMHSQMRGMTTIEMLICTAITGCIAALVVPDAHYALQARKRDALARQAVHAYDTDHDGALNHAESVQLLRDLGREPLPTEHGIVIYNPRIEGPSTRLFPRGYAFLGHLRLYGTPVSTDELERLFAQE